MVEIDPRFRERGAETAVGWTAEYICPILNVIFVAEMIDGDSEHRFYSCIDGVSYFTKKHLAVNMALLNAINNIEQHLKCALMLGERVGPLMLTERVRQGQDGGGNGVGKRLRTESIEAEDGL